MATEEEFIYGLPGDWFRYIHLSGIGVTCASIICSIGLIVWLYLHGIGSDHDLPISKWPLAEKLFMYMAYPGVVLGCCNLLDLLRIDAMESQMPLQTCRGFAVTLHSLLLIELAITLFASISATALCFWEKTLFTANNDLLLMFLCHLVPMLLGIILALAKAMGPSGAWCFIDLTTEIGKDYNTALFIVILVIFGLCLVSYFILLCATGTPPSGRADISKSQCAVRSLLIFTPLCFLHWTPLVVFMIWWTIQEVPVGVVLVATVGMNLGGLYQIFGYIFIRRLLKKLMLKTSVQFELARLGYDSANMMKRLSVSQSKYDNVKILDRKHSNASSRSEVWRTEGGFAGLHYVEDIDC